MKTQMSVKMPPQLKELALKKAHKMGLPLTEVVIYFLGKWVLGGIKLPKNLVDKGRGL